MLDLQPEREARSVRRQKRGTDLDLEKLEGFSLGGVHFRAHADEIALKRPLGDVLLQRSL